MHTIYLQVKHDIKSRLTLSAAGTAGGEGARTSIQVLANSGMASLLILLHWWQLRQRQHSRGGITTENLDRGCWKYGEGTDLLVVGIIRYVEEEAFSFWGSRSPARKHCRSAGKD